MEVLTVWSTAGQGPVHNGTGTGGFVAANSDKKPGITAPYTPAWREASLATPMELLDDTTESLPREHKTTPAWCAERNRRRGSAAQKRSTKEEIVEENIIKEEMAKEITAENSQRKDNSHWKSLSRPSDAASSAWSTLTGNASTLRA